MASSYTTLLKFNKPALGDAGWGTSVNAGFTDMVEQSLTGAVNVAVTSGGTTTVPAIADGVSSDARNQFITITGSLTSVQTATVQLPAGTSTNFKLYFVKNSAGGTVTVTTATGTNVAVPNGASMILRVTNAGVEAAMTYAASLTLGSALAATSGGTGQSSYAVGDLLYASSTTALSKLTVGAANAVLTSSGTGPQWTSTLGVASGGTGAATLTGITVGNGTGAFTALGNAISDVYKIPKITPIDIYTAQWSLVRFGATTAEVQAGTSTDYALTPDSFRQGALVRGTAQNTTSGTAVDFTGIPSWAKRVVLMLVGVSTNGSTRMLVQIGTSSGMETTGYVSGAQIGVGAANQYTTETTGFVLEPTSAATATAARHGSIVLENFGSNTWVSRSNVHETTPLCVSSGAGSKALSGTLDRIRITTVGAADTFDAGQVNILYE